MWNYSVLHKFRVGKNGVGEPRTIHTEKNML